MLLLEENPIIAAVRTEKEFEKALTASVGLIFLLNASLLTLSKEIQRAHRVQKQLFVHLDLAEGIGKDDVGLAYLSKIGADGIISTRSNLIRSAKNWGLQTVQRFFIVDSHSINTAIEAISFSQPSMVELMPGVIDKVIRQFCCNVDMPVIAGGLIETKEEIIRAISAGAAAASTARQALWEK